MSLDVEDTIVAIASASGASVRGIVRLSGPQAIAVAQQVFIADEPSFDWATLTRSKSVIGRVLVDDGIYVAAIALLWPDQRSYTRQPTVEIHTIGATPVLRQIVSTMQAHGARLAEPGEFTLRAFLSGRLDLTQAEAVLAVIDAESDSQFDTALQQLAGGLAGPLGELREQLLSVLAEVEAGLDFVEEDIEFISQSQLSQQLSDCRRRLEVVIEQISVREIAKTLPRVVLVGLPNSGKSSLFNVLTESDHAIVTEIAGTTTDFISAAVHVNGREIELVDTAGFESATGEISASAQLHRGQQDGLADLRLLCVDAELLAYEQDGKVGFSNVANVDRVQWCRQQLETLRENDLLVVTKMDLVDWRHADGPLQLAGLKCRSVGVSNQDRNGIDDLAALIVQSLESSDKAGDSVVGSTVQRAASSLQDAGSSLTAAIDAAENDFGEEIVAAEIREALGALGLVVGVVYTDDILDLVFGRFCIGK
jgi:tRNA modification GTPase